MNKVLKLIVVLLAVLFFVNGVRWMVAPAGIAPMFGLDLATGAGLSTQVGDMSAFFLTLAACISIAVISAQKSWYYPPIMLLGIAAVGRILAWLMHGAPLVVEMILVEVVGSLILFIASRRLPDN